RLDELIEQLPVAELAPIARQHRPAKPLHYLAHHARRHDRLPSTPIFPDAVWIHTVPWRKHHRRRLAGAEGDSGRPLAVVPRAGYTPRVADFATESRYAANRQFSFARLPGRQPARVRTGGDGGAVCVGVAGAWRPTLPHPRPLSPATGARGERRGGAGERRE